MEWSLQAGGGITAGHSPPSAFYWDWSNAVGGTQCRHTMRGSDRDGPLTHHPAQAHAVWAAPLAPQVPDEEGGAQVLPVDWTASRSEKQAI